MTMSKGDKIRVTIAAACGAVIFHAFVGRYLGPQVLTYYMLIGIGLGILIEYQSRLR